MGIPTSSPRLWRSAGALLAGISMLLAAENGNQATYVGGTVAEVAKNSSGVIQTTDEDFFLFRSRQSALRVAYRQINLVEYGQKVDRRYLAAVLVSPLFLLAKARKHFLTVGYADENGRQQALVFQVGKGAVRTVLASLEARTGLKVTYQDDEARKAGKG